MEDQEPTQDSSSHNSLLNKSIKGIPFGRSESHLVTKSSFATRSGSIGTLRGSQQTLGGFESNHFVPASTDFAHTNSILGVEKLSMKNIDLVKQSKSNVGLPTSISHILMENDSVSGNLNSKSNLSINFSKRNNHSILSERNQSKNLTIIEEDATSLGHHYISLSGNLKSQSNLSVNVSKRTNHSTLSDRNQTENLTTIKEDETSLGHSYIGLSGNVKSQSNLSVNRSNHSIVSERNQAENLTTIEEDTTSLEHGYGWDGYEEKFPDNATNVESEHCIPKCIPPWAKTTRREYGLSSSEELKEQQINPSRSQMREKIEKLMKKHNELMLVKRIESKKKLGIIMDPNKYDDMEKINMKAKTTKYYIAPFTKSDKEKLFEDNHTTESESLDKKSLSKSSDSHSISISKNKHKHQSKKELVNVIKTFQGPTLDKQGKIQVDNYKFQKDNLKCPTITLSKVREYVNSQSMEPNERELHDIIKIEEVPSGHTADRRKLNSKYIINIPQNKNPEIASLNVKIKEKRKLRLHSVEHIEETITELYHNQASKNEKRKDKTFLETVTDKHIRKKLKSPTETKTLEVISKRTPEIVPLIDKEKETDKILLIQYEQKLKPGKIKDDSSTIKKTQLLGINKPHHKEIGEMYLYGTETDGNTLKESTAIVDNASPTLRDKINLIFEELKEQTFKTGMKPHATSSETENLLTKEKTGQRLPKVQMETTDEATVQAMPEVKSAGIQVSQSMFLTRESEIILKAPYSPLGSLEKIPSNLKEAEEVPIPKVLSEDGKQIMAEEWVQSTETKTVNQDRILEPSPLEEEADQTMEAETLKQDRVLDPSFLEKESDQPTEIKTISNQDRVLLEEEADQTIESKTLKQESVLDPSLLEEEPHQISETEALHQDEASSPSLLDEESDVSKETKTLKQDRTLEPNLLIEEADQSTEAKRSQQDRALEPKSLEKDLDKPDVKEDIVKRRESAEVSLKKEVKEGFVEREENGEVVFDEGLTNQIPTKMSETKEIEKELTAKDLSEVLHQSKTDTRTVFSVTSNLSAPKSVKPSSTTVSNNEELRSNIDTKQPKTEEMFSKTDVAPSSKTEPSSLGSGGEYSKIGVELSDIEVPPSKMKEALTKNDMDKENIPISMSQKFDIIKAEVKKKDPEDMDKSGYANIKERTEMNGANEAEAFQFDEIDSDRHFRKAGQEDIRSYDLPLQQDYETKVTFSTKFVHGRKSLRKKLGWTDDAIYLENTTCPQLVRALAETAVHQPADPISFLAHTIYKGYHNQEREDTMEVWKEHLELARTMEGLDMDALKSKGRKKFNLKKYPTKEVLADKRSNEEDNTDLIQNQLSGIVN